MARTPGLDDDVRLIKTHVWGRRVTVQLQMDKTPSGATERTAESNAKSMGGLQLVALKPFRGTGGKSPGPRMVII